nr:unnamed protein product [Digitaria exilis]
MEKLDVMLLPLSDVICCSVSMASFFRPRTSRQQPPGQLLGVAERGHGRPQEIYVSTIDGAAERILQLLKDHIYGDRSVSSRNNVFYFDGWDGLGASAVLRALAERLTPTTPAGKKALAEQEFDQLIHIDCSMWESKRALQKAVAEQLKLPDEVMELFHRQDEEDDFRGVSKGSRAELPEVLRVMYEHVQNKNNGLLVIFHNGSSEEIDLASLCGFRLSGFATNKVLWTFQGRFRHRPRAKVDMAMKSAGTTDAFVSVSAMAQQDVTEFDETHGWSYFVSQEASELVTAHKINTRPHSTSDQAAQVHECFLYLLELCCRSSHSVDYDLTTHIPNYWVCDGIIHQLLRQGQRDDISADGDNDKLWRAAEALQREMQLDVDYHQYSPSSPLAKFVKSKPYWTSPTCGFTWIPAGAIPNKDMFQGYSDKLRVLKLSRCTFDFKSPPFICCHSLRFLWMDHCQGTGTSTDGGAGKEEDVRWCFERLWVLDVRHTPCDQILSVQMLDLMNQLRELNVIGAEQWDMGQLQGRLPNIRKLRVKDSGVICSCSENDLFSEANKLELLDVSGSRQISSPMRSLSAQRVTCLETVIMEGYYIEQINLRGCSKVKNLLLTWMPRTGSLDISGTAVKTLDHSTAYIENLDELYLLRCEKLRAILWPPKHKMRKQGLSKLCIDTTQPEPTAQPSKEKAERDTTSTTGTSVLRTTVQRGSQLIDEFPWYISVRDARLLASLEAICSDSREMYVEVSSVECPTIADGGCKYEGIKGTGNSEQQAPVNLQHQAEAAIYAADILVDYLKFASEGNGVASGFMSMWPCPDVPGLPKERGYIHIQDRMRTKLLWPQGEKGNNTIVVPRLIHVLPFLETMSNPNGFSKLKTLEIMWCGDLKEALPCTINTIGGKMWRQVIQEFTSLKHIHLHELPRLQSICGTKMYAPNLESVKIRGCWSLKSLPCIGSGSKVVECDCEKEWWDRLEWDDSSQASCYNTVHPRYYKKTMLRGSVLSAGAEIFRA